MITESQSLQFYITPFALAVAVLFVLTVVVLALVAWWRSGWKRATGALELLRVAIAVAVALTLLQPEWQETFIPDRKPTVAVLIDESGSMETEDVLDLERPGAAPRARSEAAAPLAEAGTWEAVTERLDVVIEPFSSREDLPREATDLNAALLAAAENHPQLAAVVLASDGDWNVGGSPATAAIRLRMRDVPVFVVPMGSAEPLPDVRIKAFEVPVFAVAGKPLRIPFTLASTLPRDERATLRMEAPGGEVVTMDVSIPAMGEMQDSILWYPQNSGEANLVLELPAVGEEVQLDNNRLEARLEVRREQLKVLLIDSAPRWEYRYLRNALERDPGVEVECLLFHPSLDGLGGGPGYLSGFPAPDLLASYDVIFLGDVGLEQGQLTADNLESIRLLVRDQASGLVYLPGLRGYQASLLDTPLGELMPVVWDRAQPRGWGSALEGKFVLTDAGRRSLLTKLEDSEEASANTWSTLPGFHWYAPAMRAKVGTEVLATHGTEATRFGRVPLIVTRTFGAGKILFMGADSAWRWRKGVEDRYHYRFWGQVVRWMAYQRNMAAGENMRLFYSPDRPQAGEALNLNANVMNLSGEPLRDGVVVAEIASPSGKVTSVRLEAAGEEAWGLFTGLFVPEEPGEHRLILSSAQSGQPLEAVIPVQGVAREQRGQPARIDVLQEIAQLTRGELLGSAGIADVVAAVAALPDPDPEIRRLPLWSHPAWVAVLFVLLGIFWVGRKVAGMF